MATDMTTTNAPRGFTTAILHSDRSAPIEHGALHKPLHLSVAYGYADAHDLTPSRPRLRAMLSNVTATASSTPPPSGGWSTRRKCS